MVDSLEAVQNLSLDEAVYNFVLGPVLREEASRHSPSHQKSRLFVPATMYENQIYKVCLYFPEDLRFMVLRFSLCLCALVVRKSFV